MSSGKITLFDREFKDRNFYFGRKTAKCYYVCKMEIKPDYKALLELAHAKMYFGKYKDRYLSDIPEYYLIWYRQKGFPEGKLGDQLHQVTEMKVNGMEHLLKTLRAKYPKY